MSRVFTAATRLWTVAIKNAKAASGFMALSMTHGVRVWDRFVAVVWVFLAPLAAGLIVYDHGLKG